MKLKYRIRRILKWFSLERRNRYYQIRSQRSLAIVTRALHEFLERMKIPSETIENPDIGDIEVILCKKKETTEK